VEDHHVDRPDVEAQQCVKLTGTNSSIDLIVLITQCPSHKIKAAWHNQNPRTLFFADLVAIAKCPEPDPIPNSTVKHFCANGTKSQGLGE
jgi:hypothetical protein